MGTPFLGSSSEHSRQQLRAKRFARLSRDLYVLHPPDSAVAPPAPTSAGGNSGTAAVAAGKARRATTRKDAAVVDQPPTSLADLVLRSRVYGARLVVPDSTVCLWTAGLLTKLPVDDDAIVHLARERDASRTVREGVQVHRCFPLRDDEVLDLDGVPVTDGPRTMADLSAYLRWEALVALGDVVLRRYGQAAVEEAVERARRRPGVRLLRRAVPLLDGGSGSPAETRWRLRLHAAGFVGLQHGVVVTDRLGGWLAAPDLGDPVARVAVQHEGKIHFEKGERQRKSDIARDELTRDEDWQVVVATSRDERDTHGFIGRVTAAYRRAAYRWGPAVLPSHLR